MENHQVRVVPEDDSLFEKLAVDLEEKCYSVVPGALSPDLLLSLHSHLGELQQSDFVEATIGRGSRQQTNQFVRSNHIKWLMPTDSRAASWFEWTDQLQTYLNRRLFLGLASFESHFTRYNPGDYYKRHFDAFQGRGNRVVSLVIFLNPGWQPDQGGELVLYPEGADLIKVTPEDGTLVLFMSEELAHEVLPPSRTRWGMAGWFRIDTDESILPVGES